MTHLGYEFRYDGMFLVRQECLYCGEAFSVLALANYNPYCNACRTVMEWERTARQVEPPTFWPYGAAERMGRE